MMSPGTSLISRLNLGYQRLPKTAKIDFGVLFNT